MSALWLLLGLLALTDLSESSNWGCYGNIRTLDTPGASCGVGRRHGLNYCEMQSMARQFRSSGPKDPNLYAPSSWITESQVSQITGVLTSRIKEIQRRFPTWTPDQYLRGGLCAYSGGPGFVRSSQDLGCDFCNDVLARAKYLKRHGF
uniref:lysozyme g-like protein 1 n=1 Tax=Urocitellus parryii TaxID=9999 RepID=UPI000E55AD38|nr:lysozyme g-like protein 1 [Urocitellus parryii]